MSVRGDETRCFALFAGIPEGESDAKVVYAGELGELLALDRGCGPANVWPENRQWLTYSDYDLDGTRVDGSDELIGLLCADPEIETVKLPFSGRVPPR